MAKTYTIYRSSRKDRVECDVFRDEECIHKVYLKRGTSSPAYIDIGRVHLLSEYDVEQTLIPGVTRREVFYRDHDIKFCSMQWNSDESYTVTFSDEEVKIIRLDSESFAFRKGDTTLALITRFKKEDREVFTKDYDYTPIYAVSCEGEVSDQVLITIFSFPVLYFGF